MLTKQLQIFDPELLSIDNNIKLIQITRLTDKIHKADRTGVFYLQVFCFSLHIYLHPNQIYIQTAVIFLKVLEA